MKPLISVIMPAYNSEKYILESINSILNQSFSDFEFIIINDASTDSTATILDCISDKRIIRIENKTQKGNYWSRNKGFTIAKGDFIAVMDSDDISIPNRLATQYEFMLTTPDCVAVGSAVEMFNNNQTFLFKRMYGSDENKILLLRDNICQHPSLMIRGDIMRDNKIVYDESYVFSSDYDFMVNLSQNGNVYNLPEVLLRYRIHESQISTKYKKEQSQYADTIRIKQLKQLLHLEPNADETRIHLGIMRDRTVYKTELEEIEKWFDKILINNAKYKIYNQEKLYLYLQQFYLSCSQL